MWVEFKGARKGAKALLDTGAGISLLPKRIFDAVRKQQRARLRPTDRNIRAVNGKAIECFGQAQVQLSIEGHEFKHKFYICQDDVSVLLGRDFMKDANVSMEPARNRIKIQGKRVTAYDMRGMKVRNTVNLISTTTLKPGQERQVWAKLKGKGQPNDMVCVVEPSRTLFARTGALAGRLCTKPTNGKCAVRILNPTEEHITLYKNVTVGVVQPAFETVNYVEDEEQGVEADDEASDSDDLPDTAPAQDSGRKVEIPARVLQDPEALKRYLKALQRQERDRKRVENDVQTPTQLPQHVVDLYERSIKQVPKQYHDKIHEIIAKNSRVFAKDAHDMGRTTWVKHDVDTGDHSPVRQRPRRLRHDQKDEIQKQIKNLQESGLIRPSESEWASNVVLVKKKDGSWRMCIDYRDLNMKTLNPDSYMLPRIDDTLDALSRAKYFCTLDILQGYHNVELTERAKQKTAFHAPYCNPSHWEYVYMPFGLIRAPRTFQRLMDRVLQGLEHKIALAYLDDIIVYGSTVNEVLDNLNVVLGRIGDSGVKLKAKKCFLFQRETNYLGHVISSEGVKCDPAKIEAVKQWHPMKTTRQVKSFLGMVCYYNKFIKNYAEVSRPLYDLLVKNRKFVWGEAQQEAFEKLKQALISAPILAYPSSKGRYILDTDASNFAYGAVLSQLQEDENGVEQERVIAYYSKTLNQAEQRYCARRRELLAIQRSVKHFDVYLRGPEFTIRTDHASLQYIKTLTDVTDQMFRWIMLLEQYSYKIEVRAGVDHANADTLSRIPCNGKICICERVEEFEKRAKTKVEMVYAQYLDTHTLPETNVFAIKFMPHWRNEVIAKYQSEDPDLKTLYYAKYDDKERPKWNDYSGESPTSKAYFHEWKRIYIWKDVLYRRWENGDGSITRMQLIVPRALQQTICREVHDGRAAAHLGKKKVLRLLNKYFYWYKMDRDVGWWIRTCEVCQRRKRPNKEPRAPMTKYVSGFPNERVAMDVVGPTKESKNGNRYVLCITDHFSKYTKAIPMPDQVATRVAKIFAQEWVYMWGEPLSLHTDRGSNFESDLLAEMCRWLQISKTRTTAYHPQGNAQVERYNQTVVDIVSKLTNKDTYDDWDEQVPIAVSAYNATEHATTGYTPNRLMFGREVMHNFDKMLPESADPEELKTWDQFVQAMDERTRRAFEVARETIGRNVLLQKKYYDRKANLIHYEIGDAIMIKDHRLYEAGTKKFADRYVGPFYVLDVLSDVNFRVARTADDKPQIIHHDRMKKIDQREKQDIEWVFKASRELERKKAKQGDFGEAMAAVMDRLTKLEGNNKYAKRKYTRREQPQTAPQQEPQPQEPEVARKRGRPRRPTKKPAKREQKEEHIKELNRKDQEEKQQQDQPKNTDKPKTSVAQPREGERRSARLREKRGRD